MRIRYSSDRRQAASVTPVPFQRRAPTAALLKERVLKVNVGLGSQPSPAIEYRFWVFTGTGINARDESTHRQKALPLVAHPGMVFPLAGDGYDGMAGAKNVARSREDTEVACTSQAGFGLSQREVSRI